jgi:uracil-DNA glycosylase
MGKFNDPRIPIATSNRSFSRSITSFFSGPKAAASSTAGPAVPRDIKGATFNKDVWVATLTDEQKALLRLEINTLHESWLAHLKDEIVTKEFLDLKRFLKREAESGQRIFPPSEDVYSWLVY